MELGELSLDLNAETIAYDIRLSNCDGIPNAQGVPIKVPCACPGDRNDFVQVRTPYTDQFSQALY